MAYYTTPNHTTNFLLSQSMTKCTSLHYRTTLHHLTLHYITPQYTILHYTTLFYTIPHHITLHHTALPHTTLHYTTLHQTSPHSPSHNTPHLVWELRRIGFGINKSNSRQFYSTVSTATWPLRKPYVAAYFTFKTHFSFFFCCCQKAFISADTCQSGCVYESKKEASKNKVNK